MHTALGKVVDGNKSQRNHQSMQYWNHVQILLVPKRKTM